MITDDSVTEDIYASSDYFSLVESFRPERGYRRLVRAVRWQILFQQRGWGLLRRKVDIFLRSDCNRSWTVNSLEEPWTFRLNAAPEDEDTPIPCSFPGVLALFHGSWPGRVFKDLSFSVTNSSTSTDMVSLAATCIQRSHRSTPLKGSQSFRTAELGWHQRYRPSGSGMDRRSSANYETSSATSEPQIYEHAQKEFRRLLT